MGGAQWWSRNHICLISHQDLIIRSLWRGEKWFFSWFSSWLHQPEVCSAGSFPKWGHFWEMRTFWLAPTILKGLFEGLGCGKILRLELGLGWGLVWMVRVRIYYAYESPHKDRNVCDSLLSVDSFILSLPLIWFDWRPDGGNVLTLLGMGLMVIQVEGQQRCSHAAAPVLRLCLIAEGWASSLLRPYAKKLKFINHKVGFRSF